MKKKILAAILVILMMAMPVSVYAHSGRTDSSGGHKDNQNKSGLGYYHYHCGGNPPHLHNGGCPYSSYSYNNYDTYDSYEDDSNYYPTSIEFSEAEHQINAGEDMELEVELYPEDAIYDEITWSSSDEDIATVDEYGNVTAYKPGTVTITAKTENGKKATFKLVIKEIPLESLNIIVFETDMVVGDAKYLKHECIPENATNQDVEWKTGNEDVLSISDDGEIEALKPGKAAVTVSQGDIYDEIVITVYPAIESVEIEEGSDVLRIKKGTADYLDIEVLPSNVLDDSVEISCDNLSIVDIEEQYIKALETGETTITVVAANGVSDTILVEVYSYAALYWTGGITLFLIGAGVGLVCYKRRKYYRLNVD